MILFVNDSTFYCLWDNEGIGNVSKLQVVPGVRDLYIPFKIENLENGNAEIGFSRLRHEDEKDDRMEDFFFVERLNIILNWMFLKRKNRYE